MKTYDVIVVGLGGLGSVVVHDLAASGANVLGIDRHPPGHDLGSSHGQTRVIRKAYFEDPSYVPLLQRSYERWRQLEAWCGQDLMDLCGVLEVGPADGVVVPGVRKAAQQHGLDITLFSRTELRQRFPQLGELAEDQIGVLEADGGVLQVEACVRGWAQQARSAGAELTIGATVLGYAHEGRYWRVVTDQGDLFAERLVLCPGAWAPRLLPTHLGRHMRVLRKPLLWFDAPPQFDRSAGFPAWLFEHAEGVFYGFPGLPDQGFKVAEHSGGALVDDPTTLDRSLRPEDLQAVQKFFARQLPALAQAPCRSHVVCMYTMSADEHPLLGAVDAYEHLYVGAGLSGHGFKMVPALGEALAQLAIDQTPSFAIDRFNPQRSAVVGGGM